MKRPPSLTFERLAATGFGLVVSVLLSVLVWMGTRTVDGFDRLNETVEDHGELLGRFDERLGHVEKLLERGR